MAKDIFFDAKLTMSVEPMLEEITEVEKMDEHTRVVYAKIAGIRMIMSGRERCVDYSFLH